MIAQKTKVLRYGLVVGIEWTLTLQQENDFSQRNRGRGKPRLRGLGRSRKRFNEVASEIDVERGSNGSGRFERAFAAS